MSTAIEPIMEFLKAKLSQTPEIGIILGSGLGSLVEHIDIETEIPYTEIPGFPQSTVPGHEGVLIEGQFGGKRVLAFGGRFHFYEGYTMEQVVLPVRIMALLGAKTMVVSNACGGVNPDFEIGDLMVITDHINLFPNNPLMGPNNDRWGTRFPDMSQAYHPGLIAVAEAVAKQKSIPIRKGIYAGLSGPCLETPAEYKYIRIIGADAVGMSTVPEVIAANHMGLQSFGVSVITDLGVEGKIVKTTHEDVVKAANKASAKLIEILKGMIEAL